MFTIEILCLISSLTRKGSAVGAETHVKSEGGGAAVDSAEVDSVFSVSTPQIP